MDEDLSDQDRAQALVDAGFFHTYELSQVCRQLRDLNVEGFDGDIRWMVTHLATEFWDRDFTQTEIRAAFQSALDQLDHYAAGHESRSAECAAQSGREQIANIESAHGAGVDAKTGDSGRRGQVRRLLRLVRGGKA